MRRSLPLNRIFALADQGFQGLGNLAATAVLGRMLPTQEFAEVGIAVAAYFFVSGFHRSAVVLPYITEHVVFTDARAERTYHSDWWWLSILGGLILSAVLVVVAIVLPLLIPELGWLSWPLLLGGAITGPMTSAEFGRRWLYRRERADLAALLSLVFFLVVIGAAAVAGNLRATSGSAMFAWFAASTVATIVPLWSSGLRRPSLSRSLDVLRPHRHFAIWLSLNMFPYNVYSTATIVMFVGALFGPTAAAIFTAARTLTNPAVSITSAVDSLDKPRAVRALAEGGLAGLQHSISRTRRLILGITGLYLAVVALLAGPLITLVFGGQYDGAAGEVRLLALAFFLFCMNLPSETLLIVLRKSRTLLVTRLLTALITAGVLILALDHGARGMALAIATSQLANLLFLTIAERLAIYREERQLLAA